MMPAAKHFDPVLGVDIHIIQPPGPVPPVPVPHPFTGMLIDPFDYVPILGATVMINGIPRAQAGTAGEAIPAHIPIGGVFVKPPANECEMFMGSATVAVDGDAFSHLALPVLSCHDIGMITPPRPKKKSKKKIKSMVLPTSVVLSIPSGVFVGGPPTISLMALGMRIGMAGLGRAFKKAKGKWKGRKGRKGKGKKKGKAKDNAPCGTAAHPVDVVTGACVDTLVDYESPYGPIFRWVRRYDSSEVEVPGPMGRGFRHEYERFLEIDGDGFLYTDENGEQVEFPPFPDDENHVTAGGFVLQRHDSTWFSLRPFRKPAMLFEFRDPKRPARLVRLDSGRHNLIFLHNERDQIVEIRESGGHRYVLEYDNAGRVRRLARAVGDRIEDAATIFAYTYDGRGCLTGGTDAFGATFSHGYDAGSRLTAIIDRNGYKFTYEYDGEGRCVRTRGQDGLWAAEFKYDPLARATTVTFGDGGEWVHAYDANGMVTSITDPYGGVVTRAVDDEGRVLSEKDPAGNVTEFLYSGTGAHIGRRDHLGYFALPYSEEPRPDDPLEVTPPDNAAEWEWGCLLSAEKCVDGPVPGGPLRARAPDIARLADEQNPSSRVAGEQKFDLLGRIESCAIGMDVERFRRDPEGHVVEHETPEGTARFVPASWRLLKAQTDALGNTTSFDHSMRGEVTQVRDPLGTVTAYERDQKERITVVTRGGAVRERYLWDAADNLIEKRDGEGRVLVRYEVDKLGLVVGRRFASGGVHQLKYDARGRITAAVSALGNVKVKRSFDPRGHLIEDGRNGAGVTHTYEGRTLAATILFGRFKVACEWRDTRTPS